MVVAVQLWCSRSAATIALLSQEGWNLTHYSENESYNRAWLKLNIIKLFFSLSRWCKPLQLTYQWVYKLKVNQYSCTTFLYMMIRNDLVDILGVRNPELALHFVVWVSVCTVLNMYSSLCVGGGCQEVAGWQGRNNWACALVVILKRGLVPGAVSNILQYMLTVKHCNILPLSYQQLRKILTSSSCLALKMCFLIPLSYVLPSSLSAEAFWCSTYNKQSETGTVKLGKGWNLRSEGWS